MEPEEAAATIRKAQQWIQDMTSAGHLWNCRSLPTWRDDDVGKGITPIRHELCSCGRNELLSKLGAADRLLYETADRS